MRETGSTDLRHESGRPKHARTEENVTAVDELVGLLSQEGQKQTLRSTRQISRETSLTQCSIVQIIHSDLDLKCLSFTNMLVTVREVATDCHVFVVVFFFCVSITHEPLHLA